MGHVYSRPGPDGKPRWFARWNIGRQRFAQACRTKGDALDLIARKRDEARADRIDGRRREAVTFRQFRPRLVAIWTSKLRPKTVTNRKSALDRAEAAFGEMYLSEIRRPDVEAWVASLPTAASSRRQSFAVLSSAFEVAVDLELIRANPCRKVKLAKPDEKPIPTLTPEELTRLYAVMPPLIRDVVVLIGETGMRRGEALTLRWQDVAEGVVTIRGEVAKSHRTRRVYLSPLAKATLDARAKGEPSDLIFGFSPKTLNAKFKAAADAAGFRGVSPHTLRHALGAAMASQGVPTRDLRDVLGHASIRTTERYMAHSPESAVMRAFDALQRARHPATPESNSRTAESET